MLRSLIYIYSRSPTWFRQQPWHLQVIKKKKQRNHFYDSNLSMFFKVFYTIMALNLIWTSYQLCRSEVVPLISLASVKYLKYQEIFLAIIQVYTTWYNQYDALIVEYLIFYLNVINLNLIKNVEFVILYERIIKRRQFIHNTWFREDWA